MTESSATLLQLRRTLASGELQSGGADVNLLLEDGSAYSINTLTMFGIVLSLSLLVGDAIVVVENVERLMREERLSLREATVRSMGEVTSALVGIAIVLSAVFLPMAFFSGSTGVIYRQFSITIVSAMVLSVVVALTLTPALCATLLRAHDGDGASRGLAGSTGASIACWAITKVAWRTS